MAIPVRFDLAAPVITRPPADQTVTEGDRPTFSVAATGSNLSYQWYQGECTSSPFFVPLFGETGPSYSPGAVTPGEDACRYSVKVCSSGGTPPVQSCVNASALLRVNRYVAAPTFAEQPVDRTVVEGGTAVFQATATGGPAPTVTWYALTGAGPVALACPPTTGASRSTTASCAIASVTRAQDGLRVFARAANSTSPSPVDSNVARLTVWTAPGILSGLSLPVLRDGDAATASVVATGNPAPTGYRWTIGSEVLACTAASCTFTAALRHDGQTLTVEVSNGVGSPTSSAVVLVVRPAQRAPTITSPLQPVTVLEGAAATFAVVAAGDPAPTGYAWTLGGTPIPGCSGATCTFTPAFADSGRAVQVTVGNGIAPDATSSALLTVTRLSPTITRPLAATTVAEGQAATFTVAASGSPAPSNFTWTLGGVAIAGCAGATCTFTPAWTDSGASVRVVVGNGVLPDAESSAALTVTVGDVVAAILQQPQAASVVEPAAASFSVVAMGTPAPTYQWQSSDDGGTTWSAISGATATSYTTPATAVAQSGRLFRVEVTNQVRTPPLTTTTVTAVSGTARLDVTATPPPPNALVATAIVAGYRSSFAVAQDGTVWAWGEAVDAATGQYNDTGFGTAPWATRPVQVLVGPATPLAGVTALATARAASGYGSTYALHQDGTVSAWGYNHVGQLGDGTTTTRAAPVKVMDGTTALDKACAIAAAASTLVVIRSDEADGACGQGKAKRAWIAGLISGSATGAGGLPAPGTFNNGAVARPVPGLPAGVPARQVVGKGMYSVSGSLLFLLESGQVFAWGSNSGNQLGAGDGVTSVGQTAPFLPVEVTAFWAGAWDITLGWELGVTRSVAGALQAVGRNWEGQLGDGSADSVITRPTLGPVSALTSASAVSAGHRTVVAIQNGELWGWGYGWELLGITQSPFLARTPVRIGTGLGFTQLSTGYGHALALGPAGVVHAWGDGANGALGNGQASGIVAAPTVVTR